MAGSEDLPSLSNVDWTAVGALGTVATAVITVALAITAYWQISAARQEARINRTLIACDRYDLDPVLERITRSLVEARQSGELAKDPYAHRFNLFTVLNYLESLALGIERGLYDESLVETYLKPIFQGCVHEYIESGLVRRASQEDPIPGDSPEDYRATVALVRKWSHIPWYRR